MARISGETPVNLRRKGHRRGDVAIRWVGLRLASEISLTLAQIVIFDQAGRNLSPGAPPWQAGHLRK